MPPTPPATARLLQALVSLSQQSPRLINASPPIPGVAPQGASRRASVAIIIRLRPGPGTTPPNPSPSSSLAFSTETSPASPSTPLPSEPNADSAGGAGPSPAIMNPVVAVATTQTQLQEFFAQPWVQDEGTTAEMLFIKRASRATDKWSGHIAFPGGRSEPEDEDARYTAMRETWEEVGLDLAEKEWLAVGQLDDREITTSLGKRLLMILSPFVFLHTSPHTPLPELQESEVASAHWVPLDLLHPPKAKYGNVGIDISTRLAPRSSFARAALRLLVGSMHFRCILLPNEPCAIGQITPAVRTVDGRLPDLKLWGLTLGMTLDLLSTMSFPVASSSAKTTKASNEIGGQLSTYPRAVTALDLPLPASMALPGSDSQDTGMGTPLSLAPSMASIFPRFSYPDINFLIFLFGWRYRRLLSLSLRTNTAANNTSPSSSSSSSAAAAATSPQKGSIDPRVNWAGMSLGAYYSAVRRALVVAIFCRAVVGLAGLGWVGWWVVGKWRANKALGARRA